MQPLAKLLHGPRLSAGAYFDTAIRQVDGMPPDAERYGDVARANAKENALHAPGYFEQTTHKLLDTGPSGTRVC